MEEPTKGPMGGPHSEGCKCPMCQGKTCGMSGGCWSGHSCWYHVVRWVLGIAIILIVFGFGVMIGELKGELAGSGSRMMRNYGGEYGRTYPMMQGVQNVQNGQGGSTGVRTETVPVAPAANQ